MAVKLFHGLNKTSFSIYFSFIIGLRSKRRRGRVIEADKKKNKRENKNKYYHRVRIAKFQISKSQYSILLFLNFFP